MIDLELGCAGCGKTFGIATKIHNQLPKHVQGKTLYAITFTNKAVAEIKDELQKQIHTIPEWVTIQTIHSFCLERVIYPFYAFVEKQQINQCTVSPLPENVQYQMHLLKMMNSQGIIHAEQVYQFARRALCPMTSDSKTIKASKTIALDYFKCGIEALFIDEIQDVDEDILKLLILWDGCGIPISMVGDIRQALSYPNALRNFIQENSSILRIKKNLESRRVPANILARADSLYPPTEACKTINPVSGVFTFSFEGDIPTKTLLKESQLSYIKQKANGFQTGKDSDEDLWLSAEDEPIIYKNCTIDKELCLWMIENSLKNAYQETQDIKRAVNSIFRKYKIDYSAKIYAKMSEYLQKASFASQNQVMSIQKVKGLQADRCLFIIDDSLLSILLGEKNDHNKETNLLYVALTRTKCCLHILVPNETANERGRNAIEVLLKQMGLEKRDGLSSPVSDCHRPI